jgi:hypothetical protein
MKLPFTIYDLRFTIWKKSGRMVSPLTADGAHGVTRPTAINRQSSIINHKSQKGVALIITLILLAVTLVMALAFLAISRRESGSVTTAGETAAARLAAGAALANAEAQAVAGILSTTNPYDFGLLVSTNAPPLNFNNGLSDFTSLQISPRPPVFIPQNGTNDFRFYLDLNRNGHFDSNGIVADVDNSGATNGNFSFETGDPEWIGVLEHPDQPYGPDNLFIARYAFIALPVGNALDLNYIHNQVLDERSSTVNPPKGINNNPENDLYFRNQGVGSWELNLAAFLADVNTNQWGRIIDPPNIIGNGSGYYTYNETSENPNHGAAFDDARALLAYRYNNNYNTLAWVQNLFGNTGATAFRNDGIDGYSDGPLQTTFDTNEDFFVNRDNPVLPWAGADNTNHFFTPSDLFDPAKSSPAFTNRLALATSGNGAANPSTYDRYTYYRLLSQLGTDSSPESGKMNLNYDNLDPGFNGVLNTNGTASATNFIPWTPLGFFTIAADRMLREYTANWINQNYAGFTNTFGVTAPFGVTNIPVYVNGRFVYTPAVNRILQLAANIYDATESNRRNGSPDYPDVFRPLFSKDLAGDVFISGYANIVPIINPATDLQLSRPFDVETISALSGTSVASDINIYGVPWIIGAKKGFPNFNEISMENNLAVTRRLQLTRTTNSSTPVITGTNQMYTMSLSSSIGVELWNSYSSNYPGTILIGVNENALTMITNYDQGLHEWGLQSLSTNNFNDPYVINSWPGAAPWSGGNPNSASFVPFVFTGPTLTNSVYYSSHYAGGFGLVPTNSFTGPVPWEPTSTDGNGFNFPQFGVLLTNRLQVFMLAQDSSGYHVIDYVHFEGPDSAFNLNAALQLQYDGADANGPGVWNTNYPSGSAPLPGVTYGILHQISISKNGANSVPVEDGQWQPDPEAVPLGGTIAQQAAYFYAFFQPGNHYGNVTNLQTTIQAPYSPTRYISQYTTWQVNDPLVHYLASDIAAPPLNNTSTPQPGLHAYNFPITNGLTSLNLGRLNDRYMPWGGNPPLAAVGSALQFDPNAYNSAERDPLASSSDNWDFPTNKLPTVGWLGRVHRGTPWQTVYLKASPIDTATWATWTGDTQTSFNQYFDAANSAPAQDRLLFDLFTTAFNDNATRGQLSVNVAAYDPDPAAGLAAWSALFSGVVVPPSGPTNVYSVIQPAGIYDATLPLTNQPPLLQIVEGINQTRTNTALFPQQTFAHVGDILAVPQLTEQSPFLNLVNTNFNGDERYEWLPQQVMSLLRLGTPRYVIYSYGQALKPAPTPNGVYTANGLLITNYQIVAEAATRAVVRFDSTVTNINGTLTVTNNRAVIESYNILPPD